MIQFNNVLIEQKEHGLEFKNPIKVFINHNHELISGIANISCIDNKYYADFQLRDDYNYNELYPSIGYVNYKILQIGLCDNKNIDELILPLKYYK